MSPSARAARRLELAALHAQATRDLDLAAARLACRRASLGLPPAPQDVAAGGRVP